LTEPQKKTSYTAQVTLAVVGVVLVAQFLAVRFLMPPTKPWRMIGAGLLMVGAALLVAGVASGLFRFATRKSYEWLLAWRYLRVQHKRSWVTLAVGIGMLLVAAGLAVGATFAGDLRPDGVVRATNLQRGLQFAGLFMAAGGHWVLFFGFLLLFFSLFTTISVFTVFLGLEALVAVLSMMGGFENDLRQKILGTTAHVVVSRSKAAFTDYRNVLRKVERANEVLAASPYLESEVMITSQTNLSGVVLRGIDPRRIRKVTELPRFLEAEGGSGSLENLVHPERLARIPEARFRPMVTVPLGKPKKKKKDKKPEGEDDPDEEGGAGGAGARADGGVGPPSTPKQDEPDEAPSSQPASRPSTPKRKLPGILSRLEMWDVAGEVGKKAPPRPVYPGVIIGAELAKNLRLYVGDDVNVVAPLGGMSPAGPIPKSKPFRVAGIFYSGLYEYDNKFAYVTIPAAQRFLGVDDEVTGIELKVASLSMATEVADGLRSKLSNRGYKVEDWRQRNVNLFSALKLEKLVMFIVLTFIVLVASFSIVTNLNMVVLEKLREIAALKAMGAQNRSILRVFLYAGLYIGIIGMLVGVMAGVGICVFLGEVGLPLDPEIYYISELPVRMDPVEISIVAFAGVGLSFLATIYPSLMAARLRPVDGLRRHDV
jgi:lipoprotein-releasing system permease protein